MSNCQMVNVCVQHFDLYKLPESKITNVNILCLVRFQLEQISAVTDSVPKQWQPDHTITDYITLHCITSKLQQWTLSYFFAGSSCWLRTIYLPDSRSVTALKVFYIITLYKLTFTYIFIASSSSSSW